MADSTSIDIGELAKQSGPWAAVAIAALWKFGGALLELVKSWTEESRLRVELRKQELDAAKEVRAAARAARTQLDADGVEGAQSMARRRAQSTRVSGVNRRATDAQGE